VTLNKPRKSDSKNPRFFCESCGEEVPRNSKNCPKCGKYFASVRCPSCAFTGEEILFKEGCPVCGYSSMGSSQGNSYERKEAPPTSTGALPFWAYLLTAVAFFIIFGIIFSTFFK